MTSPSSGITSCHKNVIPPRPRNPWFPEIAGLVIKLPPSSFFILSSKSLKSFLPFSEHAKTNLSFSRKSCFPSSSLFLISRANTHIHIYTYTRILKLRVYDAEYFILSIVSAIFVTRSYALFGYNQSGILGSVLQILRVKDGHFSHSPYREIGAFYCTAL